MRLLMTTDTVGGVWTFTKELASGLQARGCSVVLVSFGGQPSNDQQRAADELTNRGHFEYISSVIPLEWMQVNDLAYSAAEPMLMQLCRRFQPDALLLSQFCFGALPIAIPKIVIAHSDVLSWAASVGKAPLLHNRWIRTYRTLVQNGLNGADLLVAPTAATLGVMQLHYSLPVDVATIPNGRQLPQEKLSQSKQLRAMSAGRMWDPAKNLRLLAQIQSPIPLLIAGEHDLQSMEPNTLTMLGRKSESELQQLFRDSAIYVCCSIYEPFGLAPLEAALCGCAVLANDLPSLREVWDDGALYFKDAHMLEELLHKLAQDASYLAEAQERSSQRAAMFTADRMTETYLRHILQREAAVEEQTRAA